MKYDVLILGCGPAGYYFAKNYAKCKKKVAIIEKARLGGVGFRTGCLPVKKYLDKIRDVNISKKLIKNEICEVKLAMKKLYTSVRDDLFEIEEMIQKNLRALKVDIYFGNGEFLSQNEFRINDIILKFDKCVLATGTSPRGFGDITIDEDIILSHIGAVNMEDLPEDICIIGANVEGIEFASLFSSLGVKVTVIDMDKEILKGNDEDLKELTVNYLRENNVDFILGNKVKNIELKDNRARISFGDRNIYASKALVTGIRRPNIPKGLKEIGVRIEADCIPVNDFFKTNVENIYAIGDINGILGMAHIGINQGIELSEYFINNTKPKKNYKALPRAIYTIYEIAGAGYQENELKNEEYKVEKIHFKDTFRGFSKGLHEGFLKILTDRNNKIIGLWISSENASDLVGDVGIWIDRGFKIDDIKSKLFIHPTLGEAILDAVLKF
ncbi:dihydrolipoyl dehydrogenase family protein [Paramaledivibacter caminithermalis]|jgi:dihydrolipoamide dehydrogenase|uniref:Dihydrolipoamide dehydrogenase n=1 Tax=Paramaledivibacter caminithermalis (strain DSM 15212 / CIP 107654 / DViRD3) TaxID=1121301 RepID=A0A1M6RBL9_PARC5|nr:NAD(P)/FAD-dependent oxidoreductase [Paramaledivibacter caminithermalis]SHK29859.1 dihydrolipoamide dehydrogenase [Paramaledivibacter caminithermalis DSM 15212]